MLNAFVGAMVGVERSVLPLLASTVFGVDSAAVALSFLIAFGVTKALANLAAGTLATTVGRKRLLLLGWLFGLPVPLLLNWAPSWSWIVFANALLGINQGLAWSATVIMKIDLAGPRQRGLAMGLNEFAGYLAVALAALAAGYLAASYGPRPAPFLIALGAALAGLVLTVLLLEDTAQHVELEHADSGANAFPAQSPTTFLTRVWQTSWLDRRLLAANQAGLVNNLNDGVAWGILPIFFAAGGLGAREIGWLAALYPASWAIVQLATGALSDRWGRRGLIAGGMLLQAVALCAFPLQRTFPMWAASAVLLGIGTAAVYPTLIAQVSDLVPPRSRADAVGIYRLWRDLGYAVGGLLAGALADLLGLRASIWLIAALTASSGLLTLRLLPPSPQRV